MSDETIAGAGAADPGEDARPDRILDVGALRAQTLEENRDVLPGRGLGDR